MISTWLAYFDTHWNLEVAWRTTSNLISVAILIQNLEYWKMRKRLHGITFAFPPKFFNILCAVQLLSATTMLLPNLISAVFLFSSTLLIAAHFRGRFCGGADSMTLVVLIALTVGSTSPTLRGIALVYIAVQSILSYFVAGFVKIINSKWRSGEALESFLGEKTPYQVPNFFSKFFRNNTHFFIASWMVMLFELLFPFLLPNTPFLFIWLLGALTFHIVNFWALGINRFVWVWLATYPAILWVSATSF